MRQYPSQGELTGRDALILGDAGQGLDELEVAGKVLVREARVLEARVGGVEVGAGGDGAGEEAAAERGVGDDLDAELAGRGEELRLVRLDLEGEGRVLHLRGGDRVHLAGALEGARRALGQAEVLHLALLDQLGHGAYRLLNGRLFVYAVLVVEVNVVGLESFQGLGTGLFDISDGGMLAS